MADLTAEDVLRLQHGIIKWSPETVFGTPVAAATNLGLITYRRIEDNSHEYLYGVGDQDFQAAVPGEAFAELELRIAGVRAEHKTFLQRFLRSGGEVPSNTVSIGQEDDVTPTPNRRAKQHAGAKINTLEMGFTTANGPGVLTATVGLWTLPPTSITNLTKTAPLTTKPYTANESVSTLDGTGRRVRAFNFRGNNGLNRDHAAPASTPSGNSRAPFAISAGNREISGTIQRYAPEPISVYQDCPAGEPYVVTWTPLCGGAGLVISLTDIIFGRETEDADENGIFWTQDWRARTVDIT